MSTVEQGQLYPAGFEPSAAESGSESTMVIPQDSLWAGALPRDYVETITNREFSLQEAQLSAEREAAEADERRAQARRMTTQGDERVWLSDPNDEPADARVSTDETDESQGSAGEAAASAEVVVPRGRVIGRAPVVPVEVGLSARDVPVVPGPPRHAAPEPEGEPAPERSDSRRHWTRWAQRIGVVSVGTAVATAGMFAADSGIFNR